MGLTGLPGRALLFCMPCLPSKDAEPTPKNPRTFKDERHAVVSSVQREEKYCSPTKSHFPRQTSDLQSSATCSAAKETALQIRHAGQPVVCRTCGCMTCWQQLFSKTGRKQTPPLAEQTESHPPPMRRWYRVHPITDELYYVRPDPGLAGRTAGHPDAGQVQGPLSPKGQRGRIAPSTAGVSVTKAGRAERPSNSGTEPVCSRTKLAMVTRSKSIPSSVNRLVGLSPSDDLKNEIFRNSCKICYEKEAEVVLLPCRHGGMCEECLRRSLFSKPSHRGGRSCPFCRKQITEVIKLYTGSTVNQYGYAIKAGCFFD